jgi:hypothetical protein
VSFEIQDSERAARISKRILVIAGPTAVGKSTTIVGIQRGQLPEIGIDLGIDGLHEWPTIDMRLLPKVGRPVFERFILHYDFLFLFRFPASRNRWQNLLLYLLGEARQSSIITMWTNTENLLQQLIKGKFRGEIARVIDKTVMKSLFFRGLPASVIKKCSAISFLEKRTYHLRLLQLYSRKEDVKQIYRDWFTFCERKTFPVCNHVILKQGNPLKFLPFEEWRHLVG